MHALGGSKATNVGTMQEPLLAIVCRRRMHSERQHVSINEAAPRNLFVLPVFVRKTNMVNNYSETVDLSRCVCEYVLQIRNTDACGTSR